jgi:peptidyl-prolyl cis-trans isomerase SurA
VKKKRFIFISTLQVLLFFGYSIYACAGVEMLDRIVATVNGDIITYSELHKFKALMFKGMTGQSEGPDFEKKVLDQMVEKKLIVQEAAKLEIAVKQKEVDTAIENILERNKITLEVLKDSLAEDKSTLDEYRELLRTEILQSHVVSRQVRARIAIVEKDVVEYYEKNIKPKEKPGKRVRIQQILFLIPKGAGQEEVLTIEENIGEIRKKLVAGESFGKTAASCSHGPAAASGGDLGYFHKGELMPAIEDAAFSMKKGDISSVLRTGIGFHLIKVLDRDETEGDRSWKDHYDSIEEILYNREFESIYMSWIQKLRNKAYLKIKY